MAVKIDPAQNIYVRYKMELSKKLRDNHEILKSKCDNFEIKDITSVDLYYSDGGVQGADYKIELSLKGTNYIRYVYIWPSGEWYSASNDTRMKEVINEWINEVKNMAKQENTFADRQDKTD
jgi:hypothetical protein